MKIRIHHFYDIIRDFGSGKEILPHPYGHAYHNVAAEMWNNAELEFELVVASDKICEGCSHLFDGVCDDVITHRTDFTGKQDFNNHLDARIMEVSAFQASRKYTSKIICQLAEKYLNNMNYIYEGNDVAHTEERKQNVIRGLQIYSDKHQFTLPF